MIALLKKYFSSLLLIGMALVGVGGNYHLASCLLEGQIPADFVRLMSGINLGLALAAGMVFMLGLQGGLRSTRWQALALTLAGLLVVGVLLFISVHTPCAEGLAWVWLFWIGAWLIHLGYLYPQLGGRLALSAFSLLLTLLMLEAGTRLYMRINPFYSQVTIKPHPVIGWTMIPDAEFTWQGFNPTCISFRVEVFTNHLGHFDLEHEWEKPADTLRIAVLGDSFIQAMEVPFEERSTRILQSRLDENPPNPQTRYEVINLGLQGTSSGQMLLLYQDYGRDFAPDYVFLLVSEVIIDRIRDPYFASGSPYVLRPAFLLSDGGSLFNYPPSGYAGALAEYETLIDPALGYPAPQAVYLGYREPTDWLSRPYFSLGQVSQSTRFLQPRLNSLWFQFYQNILGIPNQELDSRLRSITDEEITIQKFVMQDLGAAVAADGAKLVILDDSVSPTLAAEFEDLSAASDWGYIRLREDLEAVSLAGEPIRFLCDFHYNSNANRVMGESMYNWLAADLTTPQRLGGNESLSVFDQRNGEWHIYRIRDGVGVFALAIRPREVGESLQLEGIQIDPIDGGLRFMETEGANIEALEVEFE